MRKMVYVPDELGQEMDAYDSTLNWSKIAQEAFRQAIEREKAKFPQAL